MTMREIGFTGREGEGNIILITVSCGQDGMRAGMVTEPIGAISNLNTINAHHDVAIQKYLQYAKSRMRITQLITNIFRVQRNLLYNIVLNRIGTTLKPDQTG